MAAVRQDGYVLEYAAEPLRADKEVVLKAVRQDSRALRWADEFLRQQTRSW